MQFAFEPSTFNVQHRIGQNKRIEAKSWQLLELSNAKVKVA
jgi:hypothetical protein